MEDIVYSVKKLLSSVDAIKPIAYGAQNHAMMPLLCNNDLAACDIADPLIRTIFVHYRTLHLGTCRYAASLLAAARLI